MSLVTALEILIKAPGESRLYNFDFAALLQPTLHIDSGQAATITSTPAAGGSATTQGSAVFQGDIIQFRISAGQDGENYALLVTAHDTGGNTLQFVGTLQVRAS